MREPITVRTIKSNMQLIETNSTDEYMIGLYNGLELALSILENREPQFRTYDKKEIEILEEQKGEVKRTIEHGVKRRQSKCVF